MPADERTRLQALAIARALGQTKAQIYGQEEAARHDAYLQTKFTEAEKREARRLVVSQAAQATGKEKAVIEQAIEPQLGIFGLGAIAASVAPGLIKGAVKLGRQALGGAPTVARRLPGAAAAIGGTGAVAGYQVSQALMPQPVPVQPQAVPAAGGNGQMTDSYGRPLIVQVTMVPRAKCPKGYVAVEYQGAKVCMLKSCARDFGWKPKPKPPISRKDWTAIKRASAASKRIRRVSAQADRVTGRRRTATRARAAAPARRRRRSS